MLTIFADIFSKILPLGAEKNIRIVAVNRREYPGSSKYTEEDLADLHAGRVEFLHQRGHEVGNFLAWFAESHAIPRISNNGKSGGFAVLGWSIGTNALLSLLAFPAAIPAELNIQLKLYLRKLILYGADFPQMQCLFVLFMLSTDPPLGALGYEIPTEGYIPVKDPDLQDKPEELETAFMRWVSSYYEHPDLASRSLAGLCSTPKFGDDPAILRMSPADFLTVTVKPSTLRGDLPMIQPQMQLCIKHQTHRALFNPELAQTFCRDVQVVYLACTSSVWECVWSFMETEREYREQVVLGRRVRPIKFVEIKGGNHFVCPISSHAAFN